MKPVGCGEQFSCLCCFSFRYKRLLVRSLKPCRNIRLPFFPVGRGKNSNCLLYTSVDNAYTSPYFPLFTGTTAIPEVYRTYDPNAYSDQSARWAVDFVDNMLYLNWQDGKKDLLAARAPMEESFFSRNAAIEQEYMTLQKKNPQKATALLNNYAQECADKIMQTYRELRNLLLVKYTNNK